LRPTWNNSEVIFDVDYKKKLIEELSFRMSQSDFWNDTKKSSQTVRELKALKATVEPWLEVSKEYRELKELADITEVADKEMAASLMQGAGNLIKKIDKLEFATLLSGEFDQSNAILSINAGAGGTESCDWVGMLFRMYNRWAERRRYNVKVIDILFGEEAGIKNATLLIEGEYAYGYLKAERGVHRLVRISPFDANKRRHTSFASVDVIPEIEEDIDIDIDEKELVIETYRSSGPGGQHMQKTDSAVRVTHKPTGIVVQSQNERSQHQNKQNVLKILKAKLYELEQEEKKKELNKLYDGQKKKIEWGSQVRSYVMHPYNMVKDHRSEYETGNVAAFMDGEIDEAIEAYLKMQKHSGNKK